MRPVAVIGVGMTKFGISEKTSIEMFGEAAAEAFKDAHLKPKDIQAAYVGNVLGEFEEGQMGLPGIAATDLGLIDIPVTRFEYACATASVAIREAFIWVASGFYDIVLAGGTERPTTMGTPLATRTFAMGYDSRYEVPTGVTFPALFGMMTYQYAKKYEIPLEKVKERMAMVAVKNHHNGTFNPKAHFRKEITVEQALNSPMICTPLQLYDCCPFTDGAAAVILASADLAKKLVPKPIYIAGVGQCMSGPVHQFKDITRIRARELSAKQAYDMAGLSPRDIDVCELHDCFTIAEIVASEGLGFFDFGKGAAAAEKGETSLKGRIPINPSGGLKAKGHPIGATGAAQVYEIVKQLRGEAGERQIAGAKIGMTDTLGAYAVVCCNLILRS